MKRRKKSEKQKRAYMDIVIYIFTVLMFFVVLVYISE